MEDDLFIAYTKNRLDFRRVNEKIKKICTYELMEIMNKFRQDFIDEIGMPMVWSWEECLKEYEVFDGEEMELAKLFDERKRINRAVGRIKKAIHREGLNRIVRNQTR